DASSLLELLLADIRNAFADKGTTVRDKVGAERIEITSADLVKALVALDGRPWAEMGKSGKQLTQNRLARMLKPLGIGPQKVGPEHARVSGYVHEHFREPFERYLGSEGGPQPDRRTERYEMRTSDIFKPDSPEIGCPVAKCEKSNNDGLLSTCPVAKGPRGDTRPNSDEPPPLTPCAHCGRVDGVVYRMNDLSRGNF